MAQVVIGALSSLIQPIHHGCSGNAMYQNGYKHYQGYQRPQRLSIREVVVVEGIRKVIERANTPNTKKADG
jgi:hypothetical protein